VTTSDMIVGLGDRHYRVERDWAQLPATMTWGFISQLAVDGLGRVHVLQRSDPPVLVFDPDGSFAFSYGAGRIIDGHGISIDRQDRVFVVDRDAHEIVVFDRDGHELFALGQRGRPRFGAPFNHPTDVAVAPDGEIYVSDGYGNAHVHRFSADGKYIATWGGPGEGDSQFMTPHAIWVLDDGRVLVVDRENERVQVFDREGRHLANWGGFFHPMDLYVDERGMIFVTDQVPRIAMLSGDGTLAGRCRGAINGAHGLWGDREGNLFLAELPPARVTKLARLAA
jgi:DNA-binding beta-propeller fold protein YncE